MEKHMSSAIVLVCTLSTLYRAEKQALSDQVSPDGAPVLFAC